MIRRAAAEKLRDELETQLDRALARALREYLSAVAAIATARASHPLPVTAAAGPLPGDDPLTLGELYSRWAATVDSHLTPELRAAFWTSYLTHRDGAPPGASPEDVAEGYLSRVSDRLVQGLEPPVYADSFDRIRDAIAQSEVQGWTRPQLAQRIAAELSWEDRGAYWRREKDRVDAAIDAILDPLGDPGTAARETARLRDPRIQSLRADRNRAIAVLDNEKSYWQNRATLIARTEATGVANHAALRALAEEGVEAKQWLSVSDARTRASHAAANGQVAPLEQPFMVGGSALMVPGDPDAPIGEVASCRCTIIGVDSESEVEEATELAASEIDLNDSEYSDFYTRWEYNTALDNDPGAPQAFQAIEEYLANGHQRINSALRLGQVKTAPAEVKGWIKGLQTAFKHPLKVPRNTFLYRGVQNLPELPEVGGYLVDKGFMSTTTKLAEAQRFQRETGWILRIESPPGLPVIPGNPGESELILPRGLKMEVVNVDPGTRTIDIRPVRKKA